MKPGELESFDREQERILREAIVAADRVLLAECQGNPEVLALLTAGVAKAFAEKTILMLRTEAYKKEMLCEVPPEVLNLREMCKTGNREEE